MRRHPEHAGRWLERETVEGEGELTLECPPGGTPIGAAALTPGGELVPVELDGRTARFGGPGRLMLFHAVERGFDYFSPPACAAPVRHGPRRASRSASGIASAR